MSRVLGAALACVFSAVSGCSDAGSGSAEADDDAALEAGTTAADMSPTLEGEGDMSSAAGAGAGTAAMDGGSAGDDGEPPVGEGEGGASDAIDEQTPAR